MSLKNMVIRFFEPKKYKIVKFGKFGDKKEVYIVLYKKYRFSDYNRVLKNNILNIFEAALEGDNFSPRVYVKRELRDICDDSVPFTIYINGIEKFDRIDLENGIGLSQCVCHSLDKCEEIIENHKEIVKIANKLKKEEKQEQEIKNRERKNSRAKTVKRY